MGKKKNKQNIYTTINNKTNIKQTNKQMYKQKQTISARTIILTHTPQNDKNNNKQANKQKHKKNKQKHTKTINTCLSIKNKSQQ